MSKYDDLEYDKNGDIIVDMNISIMDLAFDKCPLYMEELLKKGYDINQVDKYDLTSYFLNIVHEFEKIELAVKYGADLNIIDEDGFTIFQNAVIGDDDFKIIQLYLDKGNVDIRMPMPTGDINIISWVRLNYNKKKQDLIVMFQPIIVNQILKKNMKI